MSYSYCCPDCGCKLHHEEIYVSLEEVVFARNEEMRNNSVDLRIAVKDLEQLFGQEKTLDSILEFALGDPYIAFRTKIVQQEEKIDKELQEIDYKIDKLQKDQEETSDRQTKRKHWGPMYTEDDPAGPSDSLDSLKNERDKLNSLKDELLVKETLLHFSREQIQQIWKTRQDRITLNKSERYGYEYENRSTDGVLKGFGNRICPECGNRLLRAAFQKKQYLIGVVGTAAVGKSTIIAAMCDYLSDNNSNSIFVQGKPIVVQGKNIVVQGESSVSTQDGAVDGNKSKYDKFVNYMDDYRQGKWLRDNTQVVGTNCITPSVVTRDAIWTFVDVAGEAIRNPNNQEIDANRLIQTFESILKCDLYLYCMGMDKPTDAAATEALEDFQFILRERNNGDQQWNRPVLLVATKCDILSDDRKQNAEKEGRARGQWIKGEYNYSSDTAVISQLMQRTFEMLADRVYLTSVLSSAYGFVPIDPKKSETKIPQPINIERIVEWIQIMEGDAPAKHLNKKTVLKIGMEYKKDESHLQDDDVLFIAREFCNPRSEEKKYYQAIGGGPVGILVKTVIRAIAKIRRKVK